jgi:hypothetical protein
MEQKHYYVVTVSLDVAKVECFAEREALITYLRRLLTLAEESGRLQVFVFHGKRLATTVPPFPYLLEDEQQPVPLFLPPKPGPVSEQGDLIGSLGPGPDPAYVTATQKATEEIEELGLPGQD